MLEEIVVVAPDMARSEIPPPRPSDAVFLVMVELAMVKFPLNNETPPPPPSALLFPLIVELTIDAVCCGVVSTSSPPPNDTWPYSVAVERVEFPDIVLSINWKLLLEEYTPPPSPCVPFVSFSDTVESLI